jgi:hypothetical protein
MNAKVSSKVTINVSPTAVFAYLEDLKFHYLWNPQLNHISPIIKLQLGSKYQTASLFLGKELKADNIVTKFVKNKELQIENTTGLVEYRVNYKLASRSSQTVVVSNITVASKSKAFAFTAPVLKALAQRELQTDLQALKVAVEQKLN